jgi:microcystin-dependent protein
MTTFKLALNAFETDGAKIIAASESDNQIVVKIKGDPEITPDDQFGSCLSFDGVDDYLEIASNSIFDVTGAFTLEAWIKRNVNGVDHCIINRGKSGDPEAEFNLSIYSDNKAEFFWESSGGTNHGVKSNRSIEADGKWHHIAGVFDGDGSKSHIYIDGILDKSVSESGAVPAINQARPVLIGAYFDSDSSYSRYFNGQIAHIRIYDKALSAEDIKKSMLEDKTAQAAFKTEYPIDFSLSDDDERNVFYISEEATLNNFQLELTNTSDQKINITSTGDLAVSRNNYHFELRFKAKTFEETLKDSVKYIRGKILPPNWLASDAVLHEDHKVSIYLLYKGANDFILDPDGKLSFTLEYASSDGTGGSRGTTVALYYQNLQYVNELARLTGTRIKSVDIINQRGKKNIPLHVGIVGSNTILNDAGPGTAAKGTASSLKIRLCNMLQKDESDPDKNRILFRTGNMDKERNTKFTLLFDDPVGKDWDLASKNQLNAIQVSVKQNSSSYHVEKNDQGASPVFEITPPSEDPLKPDEFIDSLKPGEFIEISLTGIHSNTASGFANIYLKYEDVPGYWDGQFVVQVEKSPIYHKDMGDRRHPKRNVGIGVAPDTNNRLKVSGNLSVMDGGAHIGGNSDPGDKNLEVDGKVGIGVAPDRNNRLKVSGNLSVMDGGAHIGGNSDPGNDNLTVDGNVTVGGKVQVMGKVQVFGKVQLPHGYGYGYGYYDLLPKGVIVMWNGRTAPRGWALCDGHNRTPDLRGRFVLGMGQGRKLRDRSLGEKGGNETYAMRIEEMPIHRHTGTALEAGCYGNGKKLNRWLSDRSRDYCWGNCERAGMHEHTLDIKDQGGGVPHPNMPPYYVLAYIMKL